MDGTPSRPIPVRTDVLEPVGDDVYVYSVFREGSASRTDPGTRAVDGDGRTGGSAARGDAVDGDEDAADAGATDSDDRLLMSIPPMPGMDTFEAADQPTEVVMDREMVHLFDGDTDEAITHGLTPEADGASVSGHDTAGSRSA